MKSRRSAARVSLGGVTGWAGAMDHGAAARSRCSPASPCWPSTPWPPSAAGPSAARHQPSTRDAARRRARGLRDSDACAHAVEHAPLHRRTLARGARGARRRRASSTSEVVGVPTEARPYYYAERDGADVLCSPRSAERAAPDGAVPSTEVLHWPDTGTKPPPVRPSSSTTTRRRPRSMAKATAPCASSSRSSAIDARARGNEVRLVGASVEVETRAQGPRGALRRRIREGTLGARRATSARPCAWSPRSPTSTSRTSTRTCWLCGRFASPHRRQERCGSALHRANAEGGHRARRGTGRHGQDLPRHGDGRGGAEPPRGLAGRADASRRSRRARSSASCPARWPRR